MNRPITFFLRLSYIWLNFYFSDTGKNEFKKFFSCWHDTSFLPVSGVTILLSLTVFHNIVTEKLPRVSTAMPLLGANQMKIYCSSKLEISFPQFHKIDVCVFAQLLLCWYVVWRSTTFLLKKCIWFKTEYNLNH